MTIRIGLLALLSVLVPVGVLPAQPRVTRVTITGPQGTPTNPFRTSSDLLAIDFTSDATGGAFVATSVGGDIPMSSLLVNTSSGRVGVGLTVEGPKSIQVQVSAISGGTTTSGSAISPPITVVLDRTPPSITITQIRLRPGEAFQAFDPSRVYRTNAPSVTLRGFVNDGAAGVPPDQITVATGGIIRPSMVSADRTGGFEITADIAAEPDGPIDLTLAANDNVGGSRRGNRAEVPVGLR